MTVHETHTCRDCGAEITLPYARADEALEGYWERAYWRLVPALARELELAVAHDRQPYPTASAYEQACAAREKWQRRAIEAERRIAAMIGERMDEVMGG